MLPTAAQREEKGICSRVRESAGTCTVHRFLTSTNCVLLFLGLGLVETMIGPTLLDRANYIGTTLTDISPIFFVRGVGYVVGGATVGALGDYFKNHTYFLLCVILLWSIVAAVAQAVSYTFIMVCLLTFFYELGSGGIDNSVHRVLLKVWDKKAGPYFQLIDFSYALGAFIAPLLAQPFLIQGNTPNNTNETCTTLSSANGSLSKAECLCAQSDSSLSFNMALNDTHWLMGSPAALPSFAWAYMVAVAPWLCALLPFVIISVQMDKCRRTSLRSAPSLTPKNAVTQVQRASCSCCVHSETFCLCWRPPKGMARTAVIYFFAFLLIAIYYGLSFAYGGLVFTFAVKTLCFSKVEATNLNALFYGTFTAGGVVSIVLVLLKVPLEVLMVLNAIGSLTNTLLMVVFRNNRTVIWLGSGGLGASMASIYATTYAWLTNQVPVTGMGTAVMITAVSIADMAHTTVLGSLMEHTTPYLLLYYALGNVVVSCGIITVLLVVAHVWKLPKELKDASANIQEGMEMGVASTIGAPDVKLHSYGSDRCKHVCDGTPLPSLVVAVCLLEPNRSGPCSS